MNELTLETLAARLATLESEVQKLRLNSLRSWRTMPRTPEELEFARQVDTEGRAWREREREAEFGLRDDDAMP